MIIGYLVNSHGAVIGEVYEGPSGFIDEFGVGGIMTFAAIVLTALFSFAVVMEAGMSFGSFVDDIAKPLIIVLAVLFSLLTNLCYNRVLLCNNTKAGSYILVSIGSIFEESVITAIFFSIVKVSNEIDTRWESGSVQHIYRMLIYYMQCFYFAAIIMLITFVTALIVNLIIKKANNNALSLVDKHPKLTTGGFFALQIISCVIYTIAVK